jgi:hypothetical protein
MSLLNGRTSKPDTACMTQQARSPLREAAKGNRPRAIATRYFCDVCDAEVGAGELRLLRLSLGPDAETALLELCPGCARTLARLLNTVELRREGAGILAQAQAPSR